MDFLVKLYFIQKEGAEAVSQLIHKQREVAQNWLSYQDEHAAQMPEDLPDYVWYVREFRAEQNRAILAWLDHCQRVLEAAKTSKTNSHNY
jgi:hypothetical protein